MQFTIKEQHIMADLAQAYDALRDTELAPDSQDKIDRIETLNQRLDDLSKEYRDLDLPTLMTMPAAILRRMDQANLICDGIHPGRFMVVGSAGFPAYEMEAGNRFMDGIESTSDFDLSWKLSPSLFSGLAPGRMTLTASDQSSRDGNQSLLDVVLAADPSFVVSVYRHHKLINKNAFEVDVLCARGAIFHSEPENRSRIFGGNIEPVEMEGQDILHMGVPLRHIMTSVDGAVCPIVVPDPRCMALHKFWLASQPDRSAHKRDKDTEQAIRLWQQCTNNNMPAYPIDNLFISLLPEKWRNIAGSLKELSAVQSVASDSTLDRRQKPKN